MKRSVLKALLFIAIILLPSVLLGWSKRGSFPATAIWKFFNGADSRPDNACYFVGSSRVQRGLDPAMIGANAYNLGVAGSTFLSNALISFKLMESSQPKILFFELSMLTASVPVELLSHEGELGLQIRETVADLFPQLSLREQAMLRWGMLNRKLTEHLFIDEEIRDRVRNVAAHSDGLFGYQPAVINECDTIASMLSMDDLRRPVDPEVYRLYQGPVERLQARALASNSRLIFLLPLTVGSAAEKQAVLAIYRALLAEDKLVMTEQFFASIRHPEYLMNANHLNARGAAVYSAWLAEQVSALRKRD